MWLPHLVPRWRPSLDFHVQPTNQKSGVQDGWHPSLQAQDAVRDTQWAERELEAHVLPSQQCDLPKLGSQRRIFFQDWFTRKIKILVGYLRPLQSSCGAQSIISGDRKSHLRNYLPCYYSTLTSFLYHTPKGQQGKHRWLYVSDPWLSVNDDYPGIEMWAICLLRPHPGPKPGVLKSSVKSSMESESN